MEHLGVGIVSDQCLIIFVAEDFRSWQRCLSNGLVEIAIYVVRIRGTLPETNIAPENRSSQKEILIFQPSIFRCYVSFREGRSKLAWGTPFWKEREQTLCKSIWMFQQIFVAPKLDDFPSTVQRDFTGFTRRFFRQNSLVTSKWKFQIEEVFQQIGITPWKFNSSPPKIRHPKRKPDHLPTIIFQGRTGC